MKSKFISKTLLFSIVLLFSSCAQDKVESLEIGAPDGGLKLTVGETYTLAAIVEAPEDFSIKLEWESSDKAIVAVQPDPADSKKAVLKAIAPGDCAITATAGRKTHTVEVKVFEVRRKK